MEVLYKKAAVKTCSKIDRKIFAPDSLFYKIKSLLLATLLKTDPSTGLKLGKNFFLE